MTIQEKLKEYQQRHKAILATNFYNLETLQSILTAASYCQMPVILQLTRSSLEYIGLKESVALARQSLKDYGVEGWIHLDHGDSVELVQRCLDEGFDSVMIDASNQPFAENVRITRQVVETAQRYNANVEAELGYIAKLGQEQTDEYTTVEEAVAFVKETDIDALAIAVGSAHGFYKSVPNLNIGRIAEIHKAIDIILVLHGSSGIPDSMIQNAIKNGITKINLATEIKDTFMKALKNTLLTTDEIDLRKVFPKACKPVSDLLMHKFKIVNFS
ncbi:MAG: class II fructose-bisphosphate aldolase [Petrimonas sp.]|uniref:class II fructose-bisphosphate aldolase n=1 Tax=Petrimonas sp. TaxID=2023866 RepID=UPI002B390CB0|nr:class II fructose-bisphosphate aldolase [Petrimonas sp.]MEA4948199.1 class II fructose-bisphosphate aldolase [Petrimonas sp.]MEA4978664.1 class II fructose-bisphosphate aldolase [Petrimonas sp.]MEA5043187.1 class II fructose-bisphosphate aldolase [Petrimonas sp.]